MEITATLMLSRSFAKAAVAYKFNVTIEKEPRL